MFILEDAMRFVDVPEDVQTWLLFQNSSQQVIAAFVSAVVYAIEDTAWRTMCHQHVESARDPIPHASQSLTTLQVEGPIAE